MLQVLKHLLFRFWEKIEPNPPVDHDILEYHADQVELEKQPLPKSMRMTVYVIVLFCIIAVLWASIVKVDRVVVADGQITSSAPTIIIHPIENSIIKSFEVEVGQIVQPGQVLVSLDSTFSKADESRLYAREKSLRLQIERLRAELSGTPFEPKSIYDETERQVQLSLYNGRVQEYSHRINVYDVTVTELTASRKSLEEQYTENVSQLKILTEIEGIYENLYKKKTESLAVYLNAKFQKASKQSDVVRLRNEIHEKKQSIEKTLADQQAFISNWRNTSLEHLATLTNDHDAVKEELAKAIKLHELSELVSPSRAVVLEFGSYSVGSVARVGEAIMTLVPLDSPLEAEIYIEPAEIGYVRQGDTCRLKLATFPFQKHGTLDGLLRTVSNDSVHAEGSETPKYKAKVQITDLALKNVPDDFQLFPGMSLRAEVKIGKRRIITYFIYPLIRTLDEGLREP